MIFSERLQSAVRLAVAAHADQTRKGNDVPYIVHPLSVALILARSGAEEDVVIAGLLHDTVEDSGGAVTLSMIQAQFGAAVAELVGHATERDKSLSWAERKTQALAHIYEMPHGALLLKSADTLANLSDLGADLRQGGEEVWQRFNAPKEEQVARYQKLVEAFKNVWPENPLLPEIERAVSKLGTIEV